MTFAINAPDPLTLIPYDKDGPSPDYATGQKAPAAPTTPAQSLDLPSTEDVLIDAPAIAAHLIALGYPVHPLKQGVKDTASNHGFKDAITDAASIAGLFKLGHNVGIACGAGLLVLDFDQPKKAAHVDMDADSSAFGMVRAMFKQLCGDEAWSQWEAACGRVVSPNGGVHFYCRLPDDVEMKSGTGLVKGDDGPAEPDDGVGESAEDRAERLKCFSSMDTRCDGGYIVAPWSALRGDAGDGVYEAEGNAMPALADLPELPMAMVDWLRSLTTTASKMPAKPLSAPSGAPGVGEVLPYALATHASPAGLGFASTGRKAKDGARVKDALMASVARDPVRYGERDGWRDGILFPLTGAAATGELTEEEAKSIYDAASGASPGDKDANEAQWGSELARAHDKVKASEPLLGVKSIIDRAVADGWVDPAPEAASVEWPGGVTAKGAALLNPLNAAALAKRMGLDARFNKRRFEHEIWVPQVATSLHRGVRPGWNRLDDPVLRLATTLLSQDVGRSFTTQSVDEALMTIGDAVPFDPVWDYFEGLVWDGTPRLNTWLAAYLSVANTALHQQWARLWMIGAVARTYEPGCKFDAVLMFVSPEGFGKSTIGAALVPDESWFTDQLEVGGDAKHVIEQTAGILIAELGEMRGMGAKDQGAVKHMISARVDKARLAYARKVSEVPRKFVMYGSSNLDQPLSDPTGNRRFWAMNVGKALVAELRRDAPQLWAEAVYMFKTEFAADARRVALAPRWYDEATAAQRKFTEAPVWGDKLQSMLAGMAPSLEIVTLPSGLLGRWVAAHDLMTRLIPGGDVGIGHQRKLAEAMKALGWEQVRRRLSTAGGEQVRGYTIAATQEELAGDAATATALNGGGTIQ